MKGNNIIKFILIAILIVSFFFVDTIFQETETIEPIIIQKFPNDATIIPKSNINEPIYLMLYVGDIDGETSDDWVYFFNGLTNFYTKNKIPVTFSYYPLTIQDNQEFNAVFVKMYGSANIELMQKGDRGQTSNFESLPVEEQAKIILAEKNHFIEKIKSFTGLTQVKTTNSYNQIDARFNEKTEEALISTGFKIYFDVYIGDALMAVSSLKDFIVMQYGESFTKSGNAGREQAFYTSQEIFDNINKFERSDLEIITINDRKVIPLFVHQQDFESLTKSNTVDEKKWKTYTETILALKNDPNVIFLTPGKLVEMKY